MENNNMPKVRFLGFNDNWEIRKLGDTDTFFTDGNYGGEYPSAKDMRDSTNGIPFLRGSDLKNGYIDLSKTNYISKEKHAELTSGHVEFDDVVIVVRGSIGGLGYAKKNNIGCNINSQLAIIRTNKKELLGRFLSQYLIGSRGQKELISRNTGTALKQLPINQLKDVPIFIPSINEQTIIGNFFKQLDEAITLHEQELTTLKQTKQGFLQKMFPKEGESVPEVRFPGFTGDWVQRKLDSVVDRIKSYSLSRDVETKELTGYKYIHYGDIHTKIADKINESSNLPNIKAGNYELLKKGDLVLADASEDYQGIATPAVININPSYKLVSGLHTIALRPTQVDSLFLYYLINSSTFRKYGYRTGTGMKVFGISVTNVLKFEGMMPLIDEQAKIGNFFKQLDETIALHQKELDALLETKKAFLQKMFV